MGKTTEMRRTAELSDRAGRVVDFVSLGRLTGPNELESRLVKSENAALWRSGLKLWDIFLDGVDEALGQLAQIERLVPELLRQLSGENSNLDGIRFRISCRSAEWPVGLERELRALWAPNHVQAYELSNLRPSDIEEAAGSLFADDDKHQFLDQITAAKLDPLASRPVTLNILLQLFREGKSLPKRQVELYRRGILASIEEANELRRSSRQTGRLDVQSKLMLAARIAAAAVFSDSAGIWFGFDPDAVPDRAMRLSDISGGYESSGGISFPVRDVDLREALLTSLFMRTGEDRFELSHKTFAEFLAALYLVEHQLPPQEILRFLKSSDEPVDQVPPQLREVAAWAASMEPEFFRVLVAAEPDILLRSDVASAAPDDRAALVAELMRRFDDEQIHDFAPGGLGPYARLSHPRLGEQLEPFLTDKAKNVVVRRVAIDIVEATRLVELAPTLARVATDVLDDVHIRAQAIAALAEIGVAPYAPELKALIERDLPEDVDDEIKGWVLRALWPHHLPTSTLLQTLTRPKNQSLFGAYWMFLHQLELPEVDIQASLKILDWLTQVTREEDQDNSFSRLIPRLLVRAWEKADDSAVREKFVEYFLKTIRDGSYPSGSDEMKQFYAAYNSTKLDVRRKLILAILCKTKESPEYLGWLVFQSPPLVAAGDLNWLLDELETGNSKIPKALLIDLIVQLTRGHELEDVVFVWEAAEGVPALKSALELAYSVSLTSAAAKWQREDLERKRKASIGTERQTFDVVAEIEKFLPKVEREKIFDWWQLNLLFFVNVSGRSRSQSELNSDLTDTDAWKAMSGVLRSRMITVAYRYLVDARIKSSQWLGTNKFHRPAAAGYRAIRLLYSQAPELLDRLSRREWKKWTVSVVGVSFNEALEERRIRERIVKRCYEVAPDQVFRVINRILLKRESEFDLISILDMLDGAFDERIGIFLWDRLGKLGASDQRSSPIIQFVVRHHYQPAVQLTIDCLRNGGPISGGEFLKEEHVTAAAAALIKAAPQLAWPYFSSIWTRAHELTVKIVKEISQEWMEAGPPFYTRLTEDQIGEFFIWLYRHGPTEGNERSGRARFLSAVDHIERLRSAILRDLVSRGTRLSVAAVARLADALPEAHWLKWQIVDARHEFAAKSWKRISPREVIIAIASYRPVLPILSTTAAIKAAVRSSAAEKEDVVAGGIAFTPGVAESVRIPEHKEEIEESVGSRRILAVATEWYSGHGGLSTLNRDLCVALAGLGHETACLVRKATQREIEEAAAVRVRLVECPSYPGADNVDPLFLFNSSILSGYKPDVVIGHDHITGAVASHIARGWYAGCCYVHFIHTLPEEIEPYKARSGPSPLRGAKKAATQLKQCKAANLVVGIGPRIYRELQTTLAANSSVPVTELRPGLNEELLTYHVDLSKPRTKYCLFMGRFEDADVKGVDLARQAIHKVYTGWHIGPKPRMIMRGFSSDAEVAAIPGIEEAKPYLSARPYTSDIDEIATDIRSSSVIIMPSKREGFGLVGLEGISAGIPVLITSESGLAELLLDRDVAAAIGQTLAESCVADVDGLDAANDWAGRLNAILSDGASFSRADQIRNSLRPLLSWRAAAVKLTTDMESVLAGTCGRTGADAK